jgi:hypothetical protein
MGGPAAADSRWARRTVGKIRSSDVESPATERFTFAKSLASEAEPADERKSGAPAAAIVGDDADGNPTRKDRPPK